MSLIITPQLIVPPFKRPVANTFSKAQTGVAASSSGTTVSVSLASNPQPGHVVCVGLGFYDGGASATTVSVSDGNGNSYTIEGHGSGSTNVAAVGQAFLAYLANTPANADKTITATFGRSSVVVAIWVDDFAPSSGVPTYDNGAFASGTGAITTPIIPVSGPNELLYALALDANDAQPAQSPWTNNEGGATGSGIGNTGWFASWILSASANTAVKYPGTSGNAYNAVGMSFKIV